MIIHFRITISEKDGESSSLKGWDRKNMSDLTTSMDVIWEILPLMFSLMAIGLVFGMLSGVFGKMKF